MVRNAQPTSQRRSVTRTLFDELPIRLSGVHRDDETPRARSTKRKSRRDEIVHLSCDECSEGRTGPFLVGRPLERLNRAGSPKARTVDFFCEGLNCSATITSPRGNVVDVRQFKISRFCLFDLKVGQFV